MQMSTGRHVGRLPGLVFALVAAMLVLVSVLSTGALAASTVVTLSIDGTQQFQQIDGFGVNANPRLWNGGELAAAIDELVAGGATLWRVDIGGNSDWEAQNDDSDPNNFNWAYYDQLYSTPHFQDLWSTLKYLNQKHVTVELSASGVLPGWMGGDSLPTAQEDEFVETIAAVAVYARTVQGIDFHLLSPLNETNFGAPEGPKINSAQFARVFHKLAAKLDELGMSDVQLVGPHTTSFDTEYTAALMADPVVMAHMHVFAYHTYFGCCADFSYGFIKASAYPDRHLWVGEWSQIATDGSLDGGQQVKDEWAFAREVTDELLSHIDDGASAALLWDAWDNWHEHTPCCTVDHWGAVAKDASGTYVPKKRLFTNAQVFKFVRPGSIHVGATASDSGVSVEAFASPTTGQLSIVGHNSRTAPVSIQGTLSNTLTSGVLALYQTTATADLVRGSDVVVNGGTFGAQIDADSFFTLTNSPDGGIGAPTATATPVATRPATQVATATATSTNSPTPAAASTPPPTQPPAATPTSTVAGGQPATIVLGSDVVQLAGDSDESGEAEAFGYVAASSGTVSRLTLYLDQSNAAKQVVLGLYTDASGQPGHLLAQSTLTTTTGGQWNSLPIAPVEVTRGSLYWLAVLAPAGGNPVSLRDVANGASAQTSAATNLKELPATWSTGATWASSPAAFYALGTDSSVPVTSTPTATVTPSPSPSPSPSSTATLVVRPTRTPTASQLPSATLPLVGTTSVAPSVDSDDPGQPEAFPYTATTTGLATSASVFLDSGNTAKSLVLGVYADRGGTPGALLGQTTFATAAPGAWNSVPIAPIQIVGGSRYWLVLLQPPASSGKLAFRVQADSGSSETGSMVTSSALPSTWAVAGRWSTGEVSAYLSP
jgi:O-glycosyl hydrolase